MAELITGADGEILTYYESSPIPYIQGLDSTISNGTYLKLSNKQFILQDLSRVSLIEPLALPSYFGIKNNNTLLNFEVSYNG